MLTGCGSTEAEPEIIQESVPEISLTVWYVEGDPIYEHISQELSGLSYAITYKSFASDATLFDAIALNPPDLVIGDAALGQRMDDAGYLGRVNVNAQYSPNIANAFFGACSGYFPIGISAYMATVNTEKYSSKANFRSFDDMTDVGERYSAEHEGESFFALESPGVLIQAVMSTNYGILQANIPDNVDDRSFVDIYNLLADGVFTGAYAYETRTLDKFVEQSLPCGIFSSVELKRLDGSFSFRKLPAIIDVFMPVPADFYGIAVCVVDEAKREAVNEIVQLLTEKQRCTDIALSCGCIPAVNGGSYEGEDELSTVLMSMMDTEEYFFYTLDTNLMAVLPDFDGNFSAAMGLLK